MSAYTALSFAPNTETAQAEFTSNYDLDNPLQAISSYSRQLHAHTKNQLESSLRRASSSSSPSSSGRTSPSKNHDANVSTSGSTNPRRTAASATKPVSSMAQLSNERSSQGSQESL